MIDVCLKCGEGRSRHADDCPERAEQLADEAEFRAALAAMLKGRGQR